MSSKKRKRRYHKEATKYRVAKGLTPFVIENYLRSLDCPRALSVWLMYKYDEHAQIAELTFDPLSYEKSCDLASAYAATTFLSKYQELNLDTSKEDAAYEKFSKFEELCKQTNRRFNNLSADPLFVGPVVWLHNAVVRKIDRVLGDLSIGELFSSPDWGPGATTLIKRKHACSSIKFQDETGITRDLFALLPIDFLRKCYPAWANQLQLVNYPTLQIGNKVITVPKDAAIDRVIAIEPGLNLWFQLAVGKMIRRRLLRMGINLRDQRRNQSLARLGSKTLRLVTVDFSSASDSIAREVVRAILSPAWYNLMDVLRSRYGDIKGKQVEWEKFSSMGNGFTFPLQSLIFYAIATCCAEYVGSSEPVGVYGDDVVLPASAYELFASVAAFYGFRINVKKTCVTSSFRESCGSHYYRGVDVKPIYLKDKLSDLTSVFSFANAVRLYSHRLGANLCCDSRFRKLHKSLVSTIPADLRRYVPLTFGDAGLISNFDEACPVRLKDGHEGFQVFAFTQKRATFEFYRTGVMLSSLWQLSKKDLGSFDVDEDGVQTSLSQFSPSVLEAMDSLFKAPPKVNLNSVYLEGTFMKGIQSTVRQWPDLGPWLDLRSVGV
jgi:hypothetical protein